MIRLALGREPREELLQLARDHRRGIRARAMRAVGRAHLRVERERRTVGIEPARQRRGVLREEADQLARRPLRTQVARAPVAELARLDLKHPHAGRAGDCKRAVARARVDQQDLIDALARQGIQQLPQVALPILDGDHRAHAHAPAHAQTLTRTPRPLTSASSPASGA